MPPTLPVTMSATHSSSDMENKNLVEEIKSIYNMNPWHSNLHGPVKYRVYVHCCTLPNSKIPTQDPEFTMIQNLDRMGAGLYKEIVEFLEAFTAEIYEKIRCQDNILQYFADKWEEYQESAKSFNDICNLLNKTWVARQRHAFGREDVHEIYDLAMFTFKSNVLQHLHEKLTNAALELIQRERGGEVICSSLIADLVRCYGSVQTFPKDKESSFEENSKPLPNFCREFFESQFLLETERHYLKESTEFLVHNSLPEYKTWFEQILEQERLRFRRYWPEMTKINVQNICESVLIKEHLAILHSKAHEMFVSQKYDEVVQLYPLFVRVPEALGKLISGLENYTIFHAQSAVEKCAESAHGDPELYGNTLLEMRQRFQGLIPRGFDKQVCFQDRLENIFRKFVNVNPATEKANSSAKSPELLARYCDLLMKGLGDAFQGDELEDRFNQILVIYKYIVDKDVFDNFYTKLLATRLVRKSGINEGAEALMLSKLQQTCGLEYTRRMQRMLQDFILSKDVNNQFRKYLEQEEEELDLDFSIKILCSGVWSFRQSISCALPIEFERSFLSFSTFYAQQHSGRKINWVYNLSKGALMTNCFEKRYTIQASIFQMAVLLQFNSSTNFTIATLEHNTKLERRYLIQVVQALLKARLLTCEEDENALESGSVVTLFEGYQNKRLRVNIDTPLKIEQTAEEIATQKTLLADRRWLIQAAIVRTMKARKIMKSQALIAEVINKVSPRFNPKVVVIEQCIELLVEKAYLARSEDNRNTYKYLA